MVRVFSQSFPTVFIPTLLLHLDHSIMNGIGHDRSMTYESMSDRIIHHVRHSVLFLHLIIRWESRKIELLDYLSIPVCTKG